MAYTEEELFDMSDEELSAAMAEERAELQSPETDLDPEVKTQTEQDGPEDEETFEEETEQPEEESADPEEGHDSETPEDEEVPVETDNTDADNTETENDEVTQPKADEEKAEIKKYKYKANGQEFEFTQDEVVNQFGKVFGQAMNYTKKMQAIAPYRKMISALEDEGISEDDMNLMIDALKGNKDAVTNLVKRANVDVLDLDLDQETNYKPNSYGRDESELRLKEVIDDISSDKEFVITQNVVSEQWDDASRDVFAKDPELIKELHIDVQNGTFDKVSPLAMKMKVIDGGKHSDLEYYIEAGKQYHTQSRAAELQQIELERQKELESVQVKQQQRTKVKEEAPRRKAATIPTRRTSTNKVTDYLDDSDEAFDEWYKKLQDSM